MRRKIGCAVMAAGNARRFGRNKLEETVGGVRIIRRALEAVPRGELVRVVVVSQYAEIEALAPRKGCDQVLLDTLVLKRVRKKACFRKKASLFPFLR